MAALCKALTKSAGIGLSVTAVCKNAGKKTLEQDDFFVVSVSYSPLLEEPKFKSFILAIIIIELYIYIYNFNYNLVINYQFNLFGRDRKKKLVVVFCYL